MDLSTHGLAPLELISIFRQNPFGIALKHHVEMFFVTLNKSKVMEHISLFFQTVVAVSVLIVWVFRYHNVIAEFEQFGFSDVFRNFVGASKIAISTLLLTGIFYADLTPYAAIGMAAFMLAAQLSHFRVKNPFLQRLPSLVFLLMSVFVALFHFGVI
jgi:hypothetical protein